MKLFMWFTEFIDDVVSSVRAAWHGHAPFRDMDDVAESTAEASLD